MVNVSIHNLTFTYPQQSRPVLNAVNASFPAGQFSLITGVSGGGKSTLLKLIAGLLPSDTTGITFNNRTLTAIPATQRSRTVAMLFQEPSTQFTMDTVANELQFALENQQVPANEIPQRLTAALDFIGITALRNRKLMHLSGGEQQKVALAIIVAMDSAVILLDEPFASIDPATRLVLLQRLAQLSREQGKTVILADHDLSGYTDYVDRLTVLTDGQLTHLSPTATQDRLATFAPAKLRLQHVTVPANNQEALIQGHQLSLTANDRTLVTPQNLGFFAHRTTLITGPNGSGKSTLLRALVKLGHYHGEITYAGTDIHRLKRRRYARQVALMFQSAATQFLNVTVDEELALSLKNSFADHFTPAMATQLLTELNLADHREQIVYTLSSGQQKKLQLLCMLIMAPDVLLLDEPFKGLDYQSLQTVIRILKDVQRDLDLTYILVSHQLSGLDTFADYHLQLTDQHFVYRGVSA